MSITKRIKESLERRTNLIQIRVSDTEKQKIDDICTLMDIRINKLCYEMFSFGLEQYLKENPQLLKEIEVSK